MPELPASYDKYRSDFRTFEDNLPSGGPAWLGDLRKQGIASFNALGFPTASRGNEEWKYTNVLPIARAEFEYPFQVDTNGVNAPTIRELAPWVEGWTRLVFVDGRYSESLSGPGHPTNGVRAANLADAASQDGDLVERHLGRQAGVVEDGFTAINSAFLRDGAFVHVPDGSVPDSPLHLVFLTTRRAGPAVSHPRTLIVVGRNSGLTVVESYVSMSDGPYFTNAVTEIVADDGAFEFERTVSRLMEMQSADYMARGHGVA